MKRFAGCVNKFYDTLLADQKNFYDNTIIPFYNSIPNYVNYPSYIKKLNKERAKSRDELTEEEIKQTEQAIETLKKQKNVLEKSYGKSLNSEKILN